MRRNNLIRLLLMFGPMIYNSVSRYWNERKRNQQMAPPPSPREEEDYPYDEIEQEPEKPTYREDDIV